MPVATDDDLSLPDLLRVRRAVVVVDVVESVRLIQAFEADVIDRWRRFVHEVRLRVLPAATGRMVKSLGDGLLLEFERAPDAARAIFAMQRAIGAYNTDRPPEAQIHLRIGATVGELVIDEFDIYGASVNLAARVAAIGMPGDCVASVDFCDELVPAVHAELDDLGDCVLKHIDQPVRCFRLQEPGRMALRPAPNLPDAGRALRPVIAVLPLLPQGEEVAPAASAAFGAAVADDIIGRLTHRRDCTVVSRQSTGRLVGAGADAGPDLARLRELTGADFVVRGRHALDGTRAQVMLELVDARRAAVLWRVERQVEIDSLFRGESPLAQDVASELARHIGQAETLRARVLPMHSLQSYAIYTGAMTLLNRLALRDFERSREMLGHLVDRVPRAAAPHALLAKWHMLRMTQGWAVDRVAEAEQARRHARRALQLEPDHAYALAVDGLISVQVDKDPQAARQRYEAALEADHHEAYAWAAMSGLHAYNDEAAAAEAAARRAIELSPLDPALYMYESYLALALLRGRKYGQAVQAAQSSLRRNRRLTGSFRILAIAQVLDGRVDEARAVVQELMAHEPQGTLRDYRSRYPGSRAAQLDEYIAALRTAGVPE